MSNTEIERTDEMSAMQRFVNRISNWFDNKFNKPDEIMSADTAFCKSMYGQVIDVNTLITMHRRRIKDIIEKRADLRNVETNTCGDYRCVYSFPTDTVPYIDEILQVFKDKGYKITNISEHIEEFKDDHMYVISWYKNNI